MVNVIVIAEGQSEEIFVKTAVAPELRNFEVYVRPILLKTSKDCSGGAISYDRFKINARNNLRQNNEVYVTTFLDLYGLDTDFPGFSDAHLLYDLYDRLDYLESSLRDDIVAFTGCSPQRFIPHIQPYEFEALLFSDVTKLSMMETTWQKSLKYLTKIYDEFENPEHINNSYETKPSKRLINHLVPKYKKTLHGPRGIQHISLKTVEAECPHFKSWMDKLRSL